MEACPGCGALLPVEPDGPTHPYLGASAACWRRWTDMSVEIGDHVTLRHATDSYAAQHPGVDGRRQRQSVAVHLIGLCHWLEHGIDGDRLSVLSKAALDGKPDWPWLTPPTAYALTAHDLERPLSSAGIKRWAEAVWQGWQAHHSEVRAWAATLLAS